MMSNGETSEMSVDDFGSSRLLHDIEEISKALYLHDPPPKTLMPLRGHTPRKPKYVNDDLLPNTKRSSIWKWKPLKALSHIRNHRLNCIFFLHVHSIEGLPINFNDLSLCVYWKRKHEVLKSQSICVKDGIAEFDETLIHRCSVYVSKSDPHDDMAKYEPKLSLLYVSIVGAPGLDLGKHWVDLTRLLPLTLMELAEEKNHHGKWITSFKLTGKAKGATINVSFGFSLSRDKFTTSGIVGKIPDKGSGTIHNGMLQRVGSIPSNSRRRAHLSSLSFDMKDHNGILPSEGPSISFLYQLLDDQTSNYSKDSGLNEVDDREFTIIDKGIEPVKDQLEIDEENVKSFENSCIETINVAELFEGDEDDNEVCCNFDDISSKENNVCTEKTNIEELELFLHNLSISESPEIDFSFHGNQFLEHDCQMKNEEICEGGKIIRSLSLDDLTNIVVDDFMNLIGSDSEPESPRELLLRQFEKEALFSENLNFDLDVKEEEVHCSNIFDSSFLFQEVQNEHNDRQDRPSLISRRKAKMLENIETEALMQEWGLYERAFQNSPRTSSGAFGSPVYLSPERLPNLPLLGEGLGSFLITKSGGFIRSMNPLLFKGAKNGERLIVQVSNSIVLPPAMGFNGLDILLKWATVGAEKMLLQAARLMPMDDITGKTFQQVLWEARLETEVLQRGQALFRESETEETPTNTCEINSEYVSVGNIVPSAIEKIQYLLLEGLRIQSGMSNDEPPSTISVECIGGNLASTSNSDINELVDTSISLDEWIRLGFRSSAFHNAKTEKLENSFAENRWNLGDFMLSLQLLLRDPLRDYEPVGIPMLALVQVERVYIESTTSIDPMFKITEVHVTGFKADFGKKQQSGFRWLHSSGMTGKRKTHLLAKSNVLVRSSVRSMNKLKHEETLWSISSYVNGEVAKWKDLSGLNLYVRNPDIVFK